MEDERRILQKILPDLQDLLNVNAVLVELKASQILSEDECKQLDVSSKGDGELVEKVIKFLQQKAINCASILLAVVERCPDSEDTRSCHKELSAILHRELSQMRVRHGDHKRQDQAKNESTTEPQGTENNYTPVDIAVECLVAPKDLERAVDQPAEHSNEPFQLIKYKHILSSSWDPVELDNLMCTLVTESKTIRHQFASFVLGTCDILERSSTVSREKVVLAIQLLGCNPPTGPLDSGESITGLFSTLCCYCSWFNYDLIAFLAESFGGDGGRELVQWYESLLSSYLQRHIFECPPPSDDERTIPSGFEQLSVILNWDFYKCSVQDVAIFKATLSGLLQVHPSSVILRAIDESQGTILTWAIPQSAVSRAETAVTATADALSNKGVTSLHLGKQTLTFPQSKDEVLSSSNVAQQHSIYKLQHTSLGSVDSYESAPVTSTLKSVSSSTSLLSRKSLPTTASSCLQAHAAHSKTSNNELQSLETLALEGTAEKSIEILTLTHSPTALNESYIQFSYEHLNKSETDIHMTTLSSTPSLPPPEGPDLPLCSSPGITQSRPNIQSNSQSLPADNLLFREYSQSPAHWPASCPATIGEQAVASVQIRKFESKSSDLKSPQSASVINIMHLAGSEANPEDDSATMDAMLLAANEVKRKRGRRKRININPPLTVSQSETYNLTSESSSTVVTTAVPLLSGQQSCDDRYTQLWSSQQSEEQVSGVEQHESPHSNAAQVSTPDRKQASETSPLLQSARPLPKTIECTDLHSEVVPETQSSSHAQLAPATQRNIPEKPHYKSVSFMWRVLGRASIRYPANLRIVSIHSVDARRKDEVTVLKGERLLALYRIADRVYVSSSKNRTGYIPYTACRILKSFYGSSSNMVKLSYLQFYIQSPDGTDQYHQQNADRFRLTIESKVVQDRRPHSREDLSVKNGDKLCILYCSDTLVYAVTEERRAGFLPRVACRLTQKCQQQFQSWITKGHPFKADFQLKFSEPPPQAIQRNLKSYPTSTLPTFTRHQPSSQGIIYMMVTHGFSPLAGGSKIVVPEGTRVQILKSEGNLMFVSMNSGTTFWIPSNYLCPTSIEDKGTNITVADPMKVSSQPQHTSAIHSENTVESAANTERNLMATSRGNVFQQLSPPNREPRVASISLL